MSPKPRSDDQQLTQLTQPQGKNADGQPHEPVEIPMPLKRDVLRNLAKAAKPEPPGDGS